MSWIWAVPAGLALLGMVAVILLARRAAGAAAGFQRDIARFAELRPAFIEVRAQAAIAADTARRLHDRH